MTGEEGSNIAIGDRGPYVEKGIPRIKLQKNQTALYIGPGPEINKAEHIVNLVDSSSYILSDFLFKADKTEEFQGHRVRTTNQNGYDVLRTEENIGELFPILENASYVIGYNNRSFDMQVLKPYYPGNIDHFQVFDILNDIRDKIGRRLALNDVVYATLGKKKSGHGLMAIDYYKEGKWEELKRYCMDDVTITKELFEFGVKNKEIYYLNEVGRATIKVDWAKYLEGSEGNDVHITLPF